MNPTHSDLFPETLLVERHGSWVFTTSLKIAEHFHKAHRNVVRSIERLLEELPVVAFNVLNFERVEYKDKKGETRLMFHLSHDAFAILAMGFACSAPPKTRPMRSVPTFTTCTANS